MSNDIHPDRITENADGSYTFTPDGFRPCDDNTDEAEDCWYTGASTKITYTVGGLDGRHVWLVCDYHKADALEQLADRAEDRAYPVSDVKTEPVCPDEHTNPDPRD